MAIARKKKAFIKNQLLDVKLHKPALNANFNKQLLQHQV